VLYTLYLTKLIKASGKLRFSYANNIYLYRVAYTLEKSNLLIIKNVRNVI
ncbi:hypothetical protein K458DRAFT_314883, partial [Lentithecium fluviatile CBS 122367]